MELKGKIWKTPYGLKALALVKDKPTFGVQLAALAEDGNLLPSKNKKGTQAEANNLLARLFLEEFLERYQTFKDTKGIKHTVSDEILRATTCVLNAALATGIADASMESWYVPGGYTIQKHCGLEKVSGADYDYFIKILAERDPLAAKIWRQATFGEMLDGQTKREAELAEKFKERVKEAVGAALKAPLDVADFVLPTWAKVGLGIIAVGYAYSLVKPFLGKKAS